MRAQPTTDFQNALASQVSERDQRGKGRLPAVQRGGLKEAAVNLVKELQRSFGRRICPSPVVTHRVTAPPTTAFKLELGGCCIRTIEFLDHGNANYGFKLRTSGCEPAGKKENAIIDRRCFQRIMGMNNKSVKTTCCTMPPRYAAIS